MFSYESLAIELDRTFSLYKRSEIFKQEHFYIVISSCNLHISILTSFQRKRRKRKQSKFWDFLGKENAIQRPRRIDNRIINFINNNFGCLVVERERKSTKTTNFRAATNGRTPRKTLPYSTQQGFAKIKSISWIIWNICFKIMIFNRDSRVILSGRLKNLETKSTAANDPGDFQRSQRLQAQSPNCQTWFILMCPPRRLGSGKLKKCKIYNQRTNKYFPQSYIFRPISEATGQK